MKLTEEVAQALTNLRASPDFGKFLLWVSDHNVRHVQNCVDQEGTTLHRSQGAATVLTGILDAYNAAPALVEKLKYQR